MNVLIIACVQTGNKVPTINFRAFMCNYIHSLLKITVPPKILIWCCFMLAFKQQFARTPLFLLSGSLGCLGIETPANIYRYPLKNEFGSVW